MLPHLTSPFISRATTRRNLIFEGNKLMSHNVFSLMNFHVLLACFGAPLQRTYLRLCFAMNNAHQHCLLSLASVHNW